MTNHKTRGIVVSTLKYGETSIITHIYTELFGMQHYIVKGVRKSGKQGAKMSYFQPGAYLDLIVYHNELKELQFLKEYEWNTLFSAIFSEVKRNAIAAYCTELIANLIEQPEGDPDFFDFLAKLLSHLNELPESSISNIPVYWTLHVLKKLGVTFQGRYDSDNFNVLDLIEGVYSTTTPLHSLYLKDIYAGFIYEMLNRRDWMTVELNGAGRNMILKALQEFLKIQVDNYKKIKSLSIIETIFI